MKEDHLTTLSTEALRDLVLFVEHRPEDATADDDVRALEPRRSGWTADGRARLYRGGDTKVVKFIRGKSPLHRAIVGGSVER